MTSTPKTAKMNNEKLFTPWSEFKRYGYLKHDWKWLLCWLITSVFLALIVPDGQGQNLFQFIAYHIAMAGFGGTVFGFTILGGKDDFFEPIIKQKKGGINVLRDMVLYLFVPLVLHGIACGIIAFRILFPILTVSFFPQLLFRSVYSFIAIWATAQTYFSYRFLFRLAITRLVWKYEQTYSNNQTKTQDIGD